MKKLKAPVSDNTLLTTREKIIVLQGSKFHGCVFPRWEGPPTPEELKERFQDDTIFRLSKEQLQILDCWKSLRQIPPKSEGPQKGSVDLVQDITNDCSVVASLCAETARAERLGPGHGTLFSSLMFPEAGTSRNGKYVLKFHFNGCYRKVVIDDRLPTSRNKRTLHVFDRNNTRVIWPALVEKAYLKVRGGYDFPGSNSATDLWVLLGWIPEQSFLQSDDIVPHAFWKRIFNAFNYGDVLVTIGTGRLSQEEEKLLGLAGEHAYAIVDMKEEDGHRLFLIKNPWSEGEIWTDSVSQADEGVKTNDPTDAKLMPGTFWMDLNNVFQHFDIMYLNWNPGLFSFRRDSHFVWDLTSRSPPASFSKNPQYVIRCNRGGMIWAVLSKHFRTIDQYDERNSRTGQRLHKGYLSLYAFEGQNRIPLTDGSVIKSPYVDASNILLRFDLPAKTPYVLVVSEQDMPSMTTNFTLSMFSLHQLSTFHPAPERYNHCVSTSGAWATGTAGGNATSLTYSTNPQFRFYIPEASDISLLLEAENRELAVHLKLVWANGERVPSQITTKDVLGDSGEYRRGCALANIHHVQAGTYTIVCSTFREGQLGKFSLLVRSMCEGCTLKSIPSAEAGMLIHKLSPARFSKETDRVLAPVTVIRNTRLRVHVKSMITSISGMAAHSPLTLSIEFGQGPNKCLLGTTGDFAYAAGGLRTSNIDITTQMCTEGGPGVWVVVERVAGSYMGFTEEVQVEVYCADHGVQVGPWGRELDETVEELEQKLAKSSLSFS